MIQILIQCLLKKDQFKIEYFVACTEQEANKEASAKLTESIQKEFNNVFPGISCFQAHFHCRLMKNANLCRHLLSCTTAVPQQQFKGELEFLQNNKSL